jgi:hypothetical protein
MPRDRESVRDQSDHPATFVQGPHWCILRADDRECIIMRTPSPSHAKGSGRSFRSFDEADLWRQLFGIEPPERRDSEGTSVLCGDVYWVPNEYLGAFAPGQVNPHPGLVGPTWLELPALRRLFPGTSQVTNSKRRDRSWFVVSANSMAGLAKEGAFWLTFPCTLNDSVLADCKLIGSLPSWLRSSLLKRVHEVLGSRP